MKRFFSYIFTDNGVLGAPIAISSTYIILFVVFAAFLQTTRVGEYFVNLAFAAAGHRRGGPAKVAIFASGLMGMINGTSAGNVVATGSLTIPMMKKSGFKPEHAAAIEASASNGGQLMPPVMGAVAFLMADFLQISYGEVAVAALPGAVGGVGQMQFSPNSRNVLPGTVVFTVDIRSPDQAKLDGMRAEIEKRAAAICDEIGVGCAVEAVGHFDPVTFDPELVGNVRKAAEELGYSHMNLISGAGHDACWAAKVAPATMVMCPCVKGISHNEAEEISKEWATAGAEVLFRAVLETAEIVE